MARARLVNTGASRKRAQPRCSKCGETIEPGQQRYTWSFRYGSTYNRHATCGRPRQSELTQGRVGELYAQQEAIEDLTGNPPQDLTVEAFETFRDDVSQALEEAAGVARDLGEEYAAAAEPFGGQGENQDRADSCESWASTLEDAASEISGYEVEMPDEDDFSFENNLSAGEDYDPEEAFQEALLTAIDDKMNEVVQDADTAIGDLEL